MTVVFLNFSEGASPQQIVRFSSRAGRTRFLCPLLDAHGPPTGLFFSYGFPRGAVKITGQ